MFKRRFRRRTRFGARRSRADVQTLSLCGNVITVNPSLTAGPTVFDCLNPLINAVPIMTGVSIPGTTTSMFEAEAASRGVSFRGCQYQYLARAGAMQGTDPSLSVVSTIYMHWVKMAVNREAPFTPLFLPNLVVGGPTVFTTPVGDPTVDVLHRHVLDLWTRPQDTCVPKCDASGIVSTTDQYSQPMAHNASHSMPWTRDKIRTKRFLKDNETLFLFITVLSGCPTDGSFFFFELDLHGHIAVKAIT